MSCDLFLTWCGVGGGVVCDLDAGAMIPFGRFVKDSTSCLDFLRSGVVLRPMELRLV